MDNFIDYIEIENFKSFRHIELTGFKRINLILGRPNVGKSNLIEALSLFSLPYFGYNKKKLNDIIRVDSPNGLFYEGRIEGLSFIIFKSAYKQSEEKDFKKNCTIAYDIKTGKLKFDIFVSSINNPWYGDVDPKARDGYYPMQDYRAVYTFNNVFKSISNNEDKIAKKTMRKEESASAFGHGSFFFIDFVKPYRYKSDTDFKSVPLQFLLPPSGENLMQVLEFLPEHRKTYAQWFRQYGLQLVLDKTSHSLKIQKDVAEDEVFQLPYSSIADTLQRIIFYKTAVASNENSILLFEEPEAHAFPPYIVEFTQEVIRSHTNQFFIVTHSPLIVQEFLEDAIDDTAIFMVDFKEGQTVIRGLTNKEIREVKEYGVDLFFNNESYLP